MRAIRNRRPLAGPTLAAVLALAGTGLSGCAEDEGAVGERGTEVDLRDVRGPEDLADPYDGLLDADFYEDLTAYTGQEVTLLAEVAEVISPRVFTVTSPEGTEVGPVLVVATEDAGDVDPQAGTPLVAAATPVDSFDAGVVVDELALDVGREQSPSGTTGPSCSPRSCSPLPDGHGWTGVVSSDGARSAPATRPPIRTPTAQEAA